MSAASAQSAPSFDVASVRLSPPRTGTGRYIATDSDPSMVRYSNVTLRILIAMAYRFNSDLVTGGPAWIDSQTYDVDAKLPPGVPKDQVPTMLQTLLADRLSLAVHRENREQRVYLLQSGKRGPKLKQSREPDNAGDVEQVRGDHAPVQLLPGRIMGHPINLATLAAALSHFVGAQVVDRTGLSGRYDVDLRWTPDEDAQDASELFAALREQLGLDLESGRAPIEVLVVDRAERVPSAN